MPLLFTKEHATPADTERVGTPGRHRSELYRRIDELTPGEVLRIRGAITWGRAWSCVAQIRSRKPGSRYATRKTDSGLDIYRLA